MAAKRNMDFVPLVEEQARARQKNGLLRDEDDIVNFFMGALAMLAALDGDLHRAPAAWVLCPAMGESILEVHE